MSDITKTITVKVGTVCRNAFYVRWLNTLGGYDSFMFQINQLYNIDVEELGRAGIYVTDVATAEGNLKATRFRGKPRVQVTMNGLSKNEAIALQDLRTSTEVHLWVPATSKWKRIIPLEGSFQSYATDLVNNEFTCEFELPGIITQSI